MYFEDFSVGQQWPIDTFSITKEQIFDFASKYDPLPIHLDEEYAKSTRFGGIIASGPMTYMLFWTQVTKQHDLLGDGLVAGLSNHAQWLLPVRAGDQLHGEVTVIDLTGKNVYNGIVEVEFEACNQTGATVMTGGAKIMFKLRSGG
jgi:acyl dehydratase